jgi:hypothetical protein
MLNPSAAQDMAQRYIPWNFSVTDHGSVVDPEPMGRPAAHVASDGATVSEDPKAYVAEDPVTLNRVIEYQTTNFPSVRKDSAFVGLTSTAAEVERATVLTWMDEMAVS